MEVDGEILPLASLFVFRRRVYVTQGDTSDQTRVVQMVLMWYQWYGSKVLKRGDPQRLEARNTFLPTAHGLGAWFLEQKTVPQCGSFGWTYVVTSM